MIGFTVRIVDANLFKRELNLYAANEAEMRLTVQKKYPKAAVVSYDSYNPNGLAPSHI